jgi:Flp pilus assembly protein TadD
MEICQRCHLQGNAVLKPGKSFFDFKPGMRLTDVFDVFMPKYAGDDSRFIMASHVERLKMSDCYKFSNHELNCITCHNPHVSVKVTGTDIFNQSCRNCHGKKVGMQCSDSDAHRKAKNDNCVQCHMPSSGTEDIPHVTTHDHYIRKPVKMGSLTDGRTFAGLVCLTDSNPGPIVKATAWIQYFEKFDAQKSHLDSAAYWLAQSPPSSAKLKSEIHLNYLRQNFSALTQLSDLLLKDQAAAADAWTCYRMGESFMQRNQPVQAETFFKKAVNALPYSPDFKNKLAACYIANAKSRDAVLLLQQLIRESPTYVPALNNLGYLYLTDGKSAEAITLLNRAFALDPDYEKALQNICIWHIRFGDRNTAIQYCEKLLKKFPGRPEYSKLMQEARRMR